MTRDEKYALGIASFIAMWVLVMACMPHKAHGRDPNNRYADSPDREWFKNLKSPSGGICCDIADGHVIDDPDWQTVTDPDRPDLHYRVRLNGDWRDVYDSYVVTATNHTGKAFVWTILQRGLLFPRCFMPGNLS